MKQKFIATGLVAIPLMICSFGCNSSSISNPKQDELVPAFRDIKNGQYQHYYLTHQEHEAILSLMKLSDYALHCRLYNLKDKTEVEGEIYFYLNQSGEYILQRKSYRGNPSEQQLAELFYSINNIADGSSNLPEFPIHKNLIIQAMSDRDDIIEYEFAHWVPLFGLLSAKLTDSAARYIQLVAFGQLKPQKSDMKKLFFIKELPHGDTGPTVLLEPKGSKIVRHDRITLHLDDNWIYKGKQPHEGLSHETYWIEQNGERLAQIGVEVFSKSELKMFEQVDVKNMITAHELVLTENTYIELSNIGKRIRLSVIDSVTSLENYIVYDICLFNDDMVSMITFSCLKSVYDTNTEYFNRILNSTQKIIE